MGRTMSLPNDGEYRHKVLDLVAVGDEVITMDSDHLRLYSIVNKAAYDDTRMRDGKPVDVRAVDMAPLLQCRRLSRDQGRAIMWAPQRECLLSQTHFRPDT